MKDSIVKLIIKRDGTEEIFNKDKILNAIIKANGSLNESNRFSNEVIEKITNEVSDHIFNTNREINVEEIQDLIEKTIIKICGQDGFYLIKSYMIYRYEHQLMRQKNTTDDKILSIMRDANEEIKAENANKNPIINSTKRDYIAGEISKDICKRYIFPDYLMKAHEEGIIHIHDTDYISMPMINCCLVNLDDMLQNGTIISDVKIEKPHLFSTACNVTSQIMAQVASNQYGGQTINLLHLAKFIDVSRQTFRKKYSELTNIEKFDEFIEKMVKEDIIRGVQTLQYQILTLMTTNGQTPFCSLYIYLNEAEEDEQLRKDYALFIEEVLRQRIKGVKNKVGAWVAPTFPKILYVLEEDNISEDKPYYYLTELAAECTAKRMVPDYISEKVMKNLKQGNVYGCMGCRSFLSVYKDPVSDKFVFWSRFNKGVVTLNLPDVAISVMNEENKIEKFWKLLDERMELSHEALKIRINTLKGTLSDSAPILFQNGAIARLKPGENIDKLLMNGYSTTSLGYVGLYETLLALTGKPHTDPENRDLALEIIKYMKERCDKWNAEENYGYSLYGTPEESTTYKFAKSLQNRHGIIEGITDKNYVMNSYHYNVKEEINAFDKLMFESEFQNNTNGGSISYIETPNMQNNIPAILTVLKYMYEHVMYSEINTELDYCMKCGYNGSISMIKDEKNKYVWECPNCHNRDVREMNIARRVCGYISSANYMNQGRMEDIHDRVKHL